MLKYQNEVKRIVAIAHRFVLGDSEDQIEKDIDLVLIQFAQQLGANVIDLETDFETWWQSYPRKIGKNAAKKSFTKAVKDVMKTNKICQNDAVDFLKSKAEIYAKYIGSDKQFCKHASTWLNAGCYFDEDQEYQKEPEVKEGYKFL